jgi:hypothetical protein
MIRRIAAGFLIAAVLAGPVGAQVVRGRVTEVNSTSPVVGALVSLLGETSDSTIVSVLTTRTGEYAILAPGVGTYRLAVKRIGVERFVSVPFALGSGETRNVDVPIAALAMSLPEVSVSGLCVTQQRDLRRIASLWDEARTALEATEISLRDRLIDAQISRYAAEVEPGTLRVLFDWRSDAQVMVRQPFTSLSGDSLSAVGYWRQVAGDSVEYMAPDASALASNAFTRDHCFSLARQRRNRPDLVGLAFVPARDRTLADISGTVYLDAKSFELRFIDFQYTRLPPDMPDAAQVGGEVHFARLTSGAWIVDRWFIRMPQLVIMQGELFPRRQFREEGGTVTTEGAIASPHLASLTGVVRDTLGRGISGAVVRAIGTHRQVLTGDGGTYRLDSLPPGGLSVVVHTDGYDSFAMLATTRRIDVVPRREQRLDFRTANAGELRRDACIGNPDALYLQRMGNVGSLRLLMVDSATSVPISGMQFAVTWPARSRMPDQDNQRAARQALTDSRGAATFCDIPSNIPLDVWLVTPEGGRTFVTEIRLNRNGLVGRVVTGRVNR